MSTGKVREVEKPPLDYVAFWGDAFLKIQNIPDKGYVYKQFKTTQEWVDAFLAQKKSRNTRSRNLDQ